MHLMQLLRRAGYALHTSAEFEIVKAIKEKFCVVESFGTPIYAASSGKETLADNRFVSMKKEDGFIGGNI